MGQIAFNQNANLVAGEYAAFCRISVRPHHPSSIIVTLYLAQFLTQERNIWLAADRGQHQRLSHFVVTQLFSAVDSEAAYQKAIQILAGLGDAHHDGPGDRTEITGVALLELDIVNLFGRTVQEELAEPYGIDAGRVGLGPVLPEPKEKHELAVFSSEA